MAKYSSFLWFAAFLTVVSSSKLNVPHVLLPVFEEINANFTLEAVNGGCYTWRTMRVDLVHLIPIDPDPDLGCSSKAVVSAISKEKARNVAIVLAEEVNMKLVLRVDVIVDVIHSLNISTTTKEIIMGEVPEVFKVVAFDSQGNLFTNLEGIEFDWKIICKDLSVLRFMTFKESPYETPPEIELFEEQNKRGHIVLLEGIKSGSTKVQVRLPYDEYNHINVCEVQLSIVANLIIIPADVYVMTGDVVPFKVFSMNNGNMDEIEPPNLQYYLEAEDAEVASADSNKGEVTALKQGKTKVVLHDRNVDESDPGLKLPFATLTVIDPAYLTINVMPHKNFAILVSERHDIVVEAFSSNGNKLYLGRGVQLQIEVGELFHVEQRTKNGTWLTGWGQEEGTAPVQATLLGIVHPSLGVSNMIPVTAKNDIYIYPRIGLFPAEVILPWDPISKPKYQVEINATGGDGKFLWTSSNHSMGVVSQSGSVRTHSHGHFEVSAVMQKNHQNRASTNFHIVPPTRLEIVEFIMEGEVGSAIFLHVAVFADKPGSTDDSPSEVPFSHCQELSFKVTTSDSKFLYDKAQVIPPVGVACASIAIVSHGVGTCKVTVQYSVKKGNTLEDSVVISAYNPLKLVYPVDEVVLAVGTTIHLVFKGGPQPSIGRLSAFKRTLRVCDNTTLEAEDVTTSYGEEDLTIVKVLCRKLGTSEVTLSAANTPGVPHCKNKNAEITTGVTCGKPRCLFLQPAIKVADASSCPMDLSAGRVVVQSNQDVELDVIVKDENGHRFLNISSLKFDWSVRPPDLTTLRSPDGTIARSEDFKELKASYQVVTPKVQAGELSVKARIVGYHSGVLRRFKITPEWPEFVDREEQVKEIPLPITTEIALYLVGGNITVTPDEITLYNHPSNKQSLSVKQGSGYYELALSNDEVAEVKYLEATREIVVLPLGPGELRINVVDLCLVSQPAVVVVNVVTVGAVRVEMSDKMELGKCIPCVVKLYDESDNLLKIPNVGMIDLMYDFENNIAAMRKSVEEEGAPWPLGEVHYIVTGQELGDTKLTFSVNTGNNIVTSAPVDLQVFPPLYLHPRNATLIVGSTLQYSHKGGPQPECNIEYTLSSKGIAEVMTGGVLQALKLGQVKVHARALGVNPTTGQKLIYAQDTVDVTVIPLTGVRIMAPLTRFQRDARVPVWFTGIPDQLSPLILGAATPSFAFNWALEDPDIVEIQGAFQKIGIQYGPEDQISIRLTGINPGRTKLHLNVTVPGVTANCPKKQFVSLTDSIDVEVFEGLALTFPSQVSGLPILLAPHSSLQLQTNMDFLHRIRYKLLGEGTPGDKDLQVSPSISNPIVTVSDSGLLTSRGSLGYAMVLIISTDDYGLKQSLSVIVKVKAIHYMMLNVITNWMLPTDGPNDVIPLGTEFELRVTYHDNTGNTFTAGSANLHVRMSRADLVRVRPGNDNSSLIVSVKKPGHVVLKVWADGVKKTADYIKLHIEQTITPLVDYLITGDTVCFWTPVSSKASGAWSSSDPNVLSVDEDTGIGRAIGAKGGCVTVSNSLHPVASVQLQILPVTRVVIKEPRQRLTNARNAETFRVPLVFTTEDTADKANNFLNGWQCKDMVRDVIASYPFTCSIKFDNDSSDVSADSVFTVTSNFIPEEGLYSCDFIPTGFNSPIVSTLSTNVILQALTDNNVTSEPIEIRFVPAVYLGTELILDPQTYTAELKIVGTSDVLNEIHVTASDENLLQVYEFARIPQLLTHKIRLLDYHWKLDELKDPLYVNVNSRLTSENIKVVIKVQGGDKFHGPQCAATYGIGAFLYNNRQTIAILTSMLVIFFVTFYAYSNYVQPVINVNVTPTRSLLSSPGGTGAGSMATTCINPNQCTAVAYMQNLRRSPQTTYVGNTSALNTSSGGSPVYGDPASFYSTSPELRRNRRFM